jgi:hypothetical protein
MSVTSSATPGSVANSCCAPGDFHGGNRGSLERGKQNAAEGITYGVPVAGFKRLGDELRVGISGGRFLFGEGLRHFKTTVTDWHRMIKGTDEVEDADSGTRLPSDF